MTWCGIGALVAGLLAIAMSADSAFAFSGLGLIVLSLGWTIGPFKTPMGWSEGVLMSYQGNAAPGCERRVPRTWPPLAVPAFAFAAGLLLLATAGLWAVAA